MFHRYTKRHLTVYVRLFPASNEWFCGFFAEFHDAFCVFDKKHKGHIGNNDIKLLMRSLGFNPTETEVENMCMKVDYDGK